MLIDYLPILALFLVAMFIAVFVIVLSRYLGPQRPSRRKLMPYESGMEPIGPAQRRFPIKFNLVAMLFIRYRDHLSFSLCAGLPTTRHSGACGDGCVLSGAGDRSGV